MDKKKSVFLVQSLIYRLRIDHVQLFMVKMFQSPFFLNHLSVHFLFYSCQHGSSRWICDHKWSIHGCKGRRLSKWRPCFIIDCEFSEETYFPNRNRDDSGGRPTDFRPAMRGLERILLWTVSGSKESMSWQNPIVGECTTPLRVFRERTGYRAYPQSLTTSEVPVSDERTTGQD